MMKGYACHGEGGGGVMGACGGGGGGGLNDILSFAILRLSQENQMNYVDSDIEIEHSADILI